MVQLADDQQDSHHGDHGDDQVDHHVLDLAGDDVVDESNRRHGDRVGHLSGHVVQVVALSAGGGH